MSRKVVIIGAGGHGKVIADIIEKNGDIVYGFLDDLKPEGTIVISNYKIIGEIEKCIKLQNEIKDIYFIIAIGDNYIRKNIYEKYKLNYYTAIHPRAIIGIDVNIGEGTVVMANSCINSNTKIGKNCIINTGAIVEHDNKICNYVHLSPNTTLCGNVNIGNYTHIGAGAIIKNNISICENCIIGAGATVVKNIYEEGIYIGIPARLMEE